MPPPLHDCFYRPAPRPSQRQSPEQRLLDLYLGSPLLTPGIFLLHAVEHHRGLGRHLVAELNVLLLGGKVRKHTTHGSPLGRAELRQCLNNLGCAHAQYTTPAVPVGQVQFIANACGGSASPARPSRNRTARSVWSAWSLLPLSNNPCLTTAPASWTHSKRFAWQIVHKSLRSLRAYWSIAVQREGELCAPVAVAPALCPAAHHNPVSGTRTPDACLACPRR